MAKNVYTTKRFFFRCLRAAAQEENYEDAEFRQFRSEKKEKWQAVQPALEI